MKNLNVVNSGFLFAWAFILSFSLMSCADDHSAIEIKDGSEFIADNRMDDPDRPAEIPDPDEWIFIESAKGEMDWREIKQWYHEDLLQRKNDPSVFNLKGITIGLLTINSKFLEQAGKEDLLFFASEIVNDDRLRGNPMIIAEMLEAAADGKSVLKRMPVDYPELDIMRLAAQAEAKYIDGMDKAREDIKEEYKQAIDALAFLHRNQWGQSQVPNVE